MIRRPPRSTLSSSSAASDVYKRQPLHIVGASEAESQPVAEPGWLEWLVAESASSPGSAKPPSSAIPSCAPSSTNTEPDKPKHAPLSLIHISEPTRLLSISYAVFCLKKK